MGPSNDCYFEKPLFAGVQPEWQLSPRPRHTNALR